MEKSGLLLLSFILVAILLFGTAFASAASASAIQHPITLGIFGDIWNWIAGVFGFAAPAVPPPVTTTEVTTLPVSVNTSQSTTTVKYISITTPSIPVTIVRNTTNTTATTIFYNLTLLGGVWGNLTMPANPSGGPSWWIQSAPPGINIRSANLTGVSANPGGVLQTYSFMSVHPGTYEISLSLGYRWNHTEKNRFAVVLLTVGNVPNTGSNSVAVNLTQELANALGAGFMVDKSMFYANSSNQCVKELIGSCDNNNPVSYVCVNSKYASNITQQHRSIYPNQVCPLYMINNYVRCGLVSSYCVVTSSKNNSINTTPVTPPVNTISLSLSFNAGQSGQITLPVNPSTGTTWWIQTKSPGINVTISNSTNGSINCSATVAGCSNRVIVYTFTSNTAGTYAVQLRLGHSWAHSEYYEVAFVNVTVVPINPIPANVAVNLTEEISNAKAAGFNVSTGMFSASSASQCTNELISACDNNNPKQHICVNTAYAAGIAQQYKSIYTKPVICPLYIVANFFGCGIVDGYCIVTSKNASASTVPITVQSGTV